MTFYLLFYTFKKQVRCLDARFLTAADALNHGELMQTEKKCKDYSYVKVVAPTTLKK